MPDDTNSSSSIDPSSNDHSTSQGVDDLFEQLNSIKSSLSKNNQPLIPTLISLFEKFESQIISSIQSKVDSSTAQIIEENRMKDAKIATLEKTCADLSAKVCSLEEKFDATEAYERRDTVILSGAIPPVSPTEDIRQVTVKLIKDKYRNFDIEPRDISVCHRLQLKRSNEGTTKPPNIIVKFVRRDSKRDLIKASKNQARDAQNKLFANESLTPTRSAILQSLLKIKKSNNVLKGVTSNEGQVYAFTASAEGAAAPTDQGRRRDQRHCINTKRELQIFCDKFLCRPLEELVETWPPRRQE